MKRNLDELYEISCIVVAWRAKKEERFLPRKKGAIDEVDF